MKNNNVKKSIANKPFAGQKARRELTMVRQQGNGFANS